MLHVLFIKETMADINWVIWELRGNYHCGLRKLEMWNWAESWRTAGFRLYRKQVFLERRNVWDKESKKNGSLMKRRAFIPYHLPFDTICGQSLGFYAGFWSESEKRELTTPSGSLLDTWSLKAFCMLLFSMNPWASLLIIHQSKGPSALCSMNEMKACVMWLHSSFPFFTSAVPLWTAHGA